MLAYETPVVAPWPDPEMVAEDVYEADQEDRIWAAQNLDLPASTPKIRVVSRRPSLNTITDSDVLVATGCVG